MVDRYLSSKFGINWFGGIRENAVYEQATDGWRTRHDGSSAVQQHKGVLKIGNAPTDPKLNLNTNSQKYPAYTKVLPKKPNLLQYILKAKISKCSSSSSFLSDLNQTLW